MAFGFGFSLPNIRKAGASFIPTTLVTESWAGSGLVNGKVPTTGGGTWGVSGGVLNYGTGTAYPFSNSGTFRHSSTYQNASFNTTVYPSASPAGNTPVVIWARCNTVPTIDIVNGYYAKFIDTGGGDSASVRIGKMIAGAQTDLASIFISTSALPASFQVVGSTLLAKLNGVTVLSVTDTSITAAGTWGCQLNSADNGNDGSSASVGPVTIKTA